MAEIEPFKGLRYNLTKVKPDQVITLPYDKISPDMQEEYYKRSPYNYVRLILGKQDSSDAETDNRYTRARDALQQWQKEKVLLPEKMDAIYLYDQHYTVPGTELRRVRRSFIAKLKIEDFESGVVRPHERTLSKPKADRVNLLKTTEAHLGMIFMMYEDPEKKISQLLGQMTSNHSALDFEDDQGVRNRLWVITDPDVIAEVKKLMKEKTLFIADGHHRYETALTLKKEHEKNGDASKFNYAMMAFTNLSEEGLTVLPTHRMVKNRPNLDKADFIQKCEAIFDVEKHPSLETLFDFLEQKVSNHAIGVYLGNQAFYSLVLKDQTALEKLVEKGMPKEVANLDVTILHQLILEDCLGIDQEQVASGDALGYCRGKERGVQAVDEGEAQVTFFLNPTLAKQVQEVCMAGEVLPQKSTDFFPKLLSGMVVHKL